MPSLPSRAAAIGSPAGPGAEAVSRAVAYIQARPGAVPFGGTGQGGGVQSGATTAQFFAAGRGEPPGVRPSAPAGAFQVGVAAGRAGEPGRLGCRLRVQPPALRAGCRRARHGAERLPTGRGGPEDPLDRRAFAGRAAPARGHGARALRRLVWEGRTGAVPGAAQEYVRAELHRDDGALAGMAEQVRRHLVDGAPMARLPLDVGGSAFARQVWNRLQEIPYGETRTYAEVAAEIGRPGAARAVGNACAANPVAVVIPCHRVVRAAGGAGAYRWGADRKQALLAREASGGSP